jgi:hypothetical protein
MGCPPFLISFFYFTPGRRGGVLKSIFSKRRGQEKLREEYILSAGRIDSEKNILVEKN